MTNFAIVFVIAAFVCATNVFVHADDGDNDGNGGVPSLFGHDSQNPINFPDFKTPNFPPVKLPNADDILNLKPKDKNSKVAGTFSSFSSDVETKDGHVVKQLEASKNIDNKNGKVTEEDSST